MRLIYKYLKVCNLLEFKLLIYFTSCGITKLIKGYSIFKCIGVYTVKKRGQVTLFIILVFLVAIGILAASRFIQGFDEAFSNNVVSPIAEGITTIRASWHSHPIWQTYGHYISIVLGMGLVTFFALVLWPRVPKARLPHKPFSQTLQDRPPAAPPQAVPKAVTPPPKEPAVETKEAT